MKIAISLNWIVIISGIVFSALVLTGCVSGKQKLLDQGHKPLSSTELNELFAEKQTAKGMSSEGNSFVVTWLPDGTQSAVGKSGKTYTGTYYIDKEKYCSKMDHRDFVRCTTWFKVGEKKYRLFRENESGGSTLVFK